MFAAWLQHFDRITVTKCVHRLLALSLSFSPALCCHRSHTRHVSLVEWVSSCVCSAGMTMCAFSVRFKLRGFGAQVSRWITKHTNYYSSTSYEFYSFDWCDDVRVFVYNFNTTSDAYTLSLVGIKLETPIKSQFCKMLRLSGASLWVEWIHARVIRIYILHLRFSTWIKSDNNKRLFLPHHFEHNSLPATRSATEFEL